MKEECNENETPDFGNSRNRAIESGGGCDVMPFSRKEEKAQKGTKESNCAARHTGTDSCMHGSGKRMPGTVGQETRICSFSRDTFSILDASSNDCLIRDSSHWSLRQSPVSNLLPRLQVLQSFLSSNPRTGEKSRARKEGEMKSLGLVFRWKWKTQIVAASILVSHPCCEVDHK